MRTCNDTPYPSLANAGRSMRALTRIAGARMAPVVRRDEFLSLFHATDDDPIARPGHKVVLVRIVRTRCARSPLYARTPRDSAVAINSLAVAR
jgi:hypothetical protein